MTDWLALNWNKFLLLRSWFGLVYELSTLFLLSVKKFTCNFLTDNPLVLRT
jgi:hypothetical protein